LYNILKSLGQICVDFFVELSYNYFQLNQARVNPFVSPNGFFVIRVERHKRPTGIRDTTKDVSIIKGERPLELTYAGVSGKRLMEDILCQLYPHGQEEVGSATLVQ
jgi:hypothetical protein